MPPNPPGQRMLFLASSVPMSRSCILCRLIVWGGGGGGGHGQGGIRISFKIDVEGKHGPFLISGNHIVKRCTLQERPNGAGETVSRQTERKHWLGTRVPQRHVVALWNCGHLGHRWGCVCLVGHVFVSCKETTVLRQLTNRRSPSMVVVRSTLDQQLWGGRSRVIQTDLLSARSGRLYSLNSHRTDAPSTIVRDRRRFGVLMAWTMIPAESHNLTKLQFQHTP